MSKEFTQPKVEPVKPKAEWPESRNHTVTLKEGETFSAVIASKTGTMDYNSPSYATRAEAVAWINKELQRLIR